MPNRISVPLFISCYLFLSLSFSLTAQTIQPPATQPTDPNSESSSDFYIKPDSINFLGKLPAHPVNLKFLDETLIACLGLNGVAWLDQSAEADKNTRFQYDEDRKVLDFTIHQEKYLLVGDRSSKLQVYEDFYGSNPFENLSFEIQTEGYAVQMESNNDLIAIAAGGAGASFWTFDTEKEIINLVSRYPLPDFVRDVEFIDQNHIAITDVQGSRFIVLNIEDPLRPYPILDTPLGGGYCDEIILHDGLYYTHNRLSHIIELQLSEDLSVVDNFRMADIHALYPYDEVVYINDMLIADDHIIAVEKEKGLTVVPLHATDLEPRNVYSKTKKKMVSLAKHPTQQKLYIGTLEGKVFSIEYQVK